MYIFVIFCIVVRSSKLFYGIRILHYLSTLTKEILTFFVLVSSTFLYFLSIRQKLLSVKVLIQKYF
jgi:hypothetical protein